MNKLYGKNIINQTTINLNGEYCDVYCLEDEEYFNIHIINCKYEDSELNTLRLQEPKEFKDATSDIFLTCQGIEFLLYDKFYGKKGKMHSFVCELVESVEL